MTKEDIEREFETWWIKEEKGMPPFTEFNKVALYSFSKLAYLTAYTSAAEAIAKRLGV